MLHSTTKASPLYPIATRSQPPSFPPASTYHEDNDQPYADLSDPQVLVARQQNTLLGFVHTAIWHKDRGGETWRIGNHPIEDLLADQVGLIRCFYHRPGHRAAGQALLEAAQTHFAQRNLHQIRAFSFHSYRFYRFGRTFLPDRLGHLRGLLGYNDYHITRGSILLELPQYQYSEPTLPDVGIKVEVELQQGRGQRPNIALHLYRGSDTIGEAACISAGHFCRAPQAQTTFYFPWFFIKGNNVAARQSQGEQGKGLGRYMMQRALWEAAQQGYETATLHVGMGDMRPQLFYTNLGFQVVDTSYQFFKDSKNELPPTVFRQVGL